MAISSAYSFGLEAALNEPGFELLEMVALDADHAIFAGAAAATQLFELLRHLRQVGGITRNIGDERHDLASAVLAIPSEANKTIVWGLRRRFSSILLTMALRLGQVTAFANGDAAYSGSVNRRPLA